MGDGAWWLPWVCWGLGWLAVTVGLHVFVCHLVVGGWVVVVMAVVVGDGGWAVGLGVVVETKQGGASRSV